ncbi:hypothetical protein [Corallococcus sp. EGB]|uniref:hypothetical protein n=1 Tax=Corallococcus sp. EGB TaxID=1521117 RepID=UPI001CBE8D0C|nr:hypothetical protein [Corallococcus sp. EGB]
MDLKPFRPRLAAVFTVALATTCAATPPPLPLHSPHEQVALFQFLAELSRAP